MAMLNDAFDAYEEGRYEIALLLYEDAALMGLKIAQSNAAYIYDHVRASLPPLSSLTSRWLADSVEGSGAQRHRHVVRALSYYELAAEQRRHSAYLRIGDFYYYGLAGMKKARGAGELVCPRGSLRNRIWPRRCTITRSRTSSARLTLRGISATCISGARCVALFFSFLLSRCCVFIILDRARLAAERACLVRAFTPGGVRSPAAPSDDPSVIGSLTYQIELVCLPCPHASQGLTRDLHLAKRFYDASTARSPDAVVPAALANLGVYLNFVYEWLTYVTPPPPPLSTRRGCASSLDIAPPSLSRCRCLSSQVLRSSERPVIPPGGTGGVRVPRPRQGRHRAPPPHPPSRLPWRSCFVPTARSHRRGALGHVPAVVLHGPAGPAPLAPLSPRVSAADAPRSELRPSL